MQYCWKLFRNWADPSEEYETSAPYTLPCWEITFNSAPDGAVPVRETSCFRFGSAQMLLKRRGPEARISANLHAIMDSTVVRGFLLSQAYKMKTFETWEDKNDLVTPHILFKKKPDTTKLSYCKVMTAVISVWNKFSVHSVSYATYSLLTSTYKNGVTTQNGCDICFQHHKQPCYTRIRNFFRKFFGIRMLNSAHL